MLGAGALGALSHTGARRVLPLEETWRSALLLPSPDDIAGDESAHEQEGWPYFVFGCPLYLLGSSKLWGSATTRGGRCEIGRCGGITPHEARENGFLYGTRFPENGSQTGWLLFTGNPDLDLCYTICDLDGDAHTDRPALARALDKTICKRDGWTARFRENEAPIPYKTDASDAHQ